MTKQQLQEELKQSMLLKDAFKTSVLRMLISAIGYLEIQKGLGYQASEEDIMSAIEKQVKQRKDSIEQYEKAGRNDLVDKEKKELELLEKYLPEQMGEEEIRNLIKEAISQTGATTLADRGNVMGALMPKTKGKADGSLVSKIVREELS